MENRQANKVKTGRQLSFFNDKSVRRSFISRFTMNPKKDIIKILRYENLYGLRVVLQPEDMAISHISCNIHFVNKHKPFVKENKKYYYDVR